MKNQFTNDAVVDDFQEWSDCQLVTRQITRRLQEFGYPASLKPEWRLSCCQGDGVCFYGDLDSEVLFRLLPGLLAEDAEALAVLLPLAENGELTAKLTRNHCGHHYTHENCFDISTDSFGDNVSKHSAVVERFESALKEDLQGICRLAECDGYALLHEAFSPDLEERTLYHRSSKNFMLTVEAQPSDYLCFFGSTQDADELLDTLISGENRLIGVKTTVRERTLGTKLSRVYGTALIPRHCTDRKWLPRGVVKGVIAEARDTIAAQLSSFSSFKSSVKAV